MTPREEILADMSGGSRKNAVRVSWIVQMQEK